MSVHLAIAGVEVPGTLVTINVSDLPAATSGATDGGWIFLALAAPVVLVGATSYTVEAKTSSANQVTLYTNATTNNFSRALRTTTTQAPVAGDDMIVAGEHTGAGTGNSFTVTMDQTAATDYGNNTTTAVTPAIAICKRGTLEFKNSSAANPYLRVSGYLIVYNGGTLNTGSVATPIPRDSTAILEFDCAADGDFGLVVRNGGTWTSQGLSRTAAKLVVSCKMSADASASGGAPSTSTISVDTDTGWLSSDIVAVASTSRTNTDCEFGTLNADAGSTSMVVKNMTVAAAGAAIPPTSNRGLLVAHSGTAPTQAEVILLSRNVKIRSVSATNMTFVQLRDGSTIDVDWTEFYYIGVSGTSGKRGLELNDTGAFAFNVSIQYSSMHDFEGYPYYLNSALSFTLWEFNYNMIWNTLGLNINNAITATNYTIDHCIIMRSSGVSFIMGDIGGTFTNNTGIGASTNSMSLSEATAALGTWSGNVYHSNGTFGVRWVSGNISGNMGTVICWRNGGVGFSMEAITFDFTCSPTLFGNTTANIDISPNFVDVTFNNIVFGSDSTFTTTNGIRLNGAGAYMITMNGGDASGVSILANHTNDINVNIGSLFAAIIGKNVKMNAATPILNVATNLTNSSYVSLEKVNQTAGSHRTTRKVGTLATDTGVFNTASPSLVMTPTSASVKLESATKNNGMQAAVSSGNTVTPSVYVRKTAAYNGSQPRLIVRANPAVGITADTVLATYSAGTGAWNVMSGTTIAVTDDGVVEFIVDCDGTAGAINVDDWSFT